jgi:hypothetical protein
MRRLLLILSLLALVLGTTVVASAASGAVRSPLASAGASKLRVPMKRATTAVTGQPKKSASTAALKTVVPAVAAFDTTATITDPAWFVQMYQAGFRLYVLHTTQWGTCQPWPEAERQIGLALAAGLKVAAYTRDPRCWQGGIAAAGAYASELQFFALDIETDPGVPLTRAMVDGVKSLGVRPVIYSGWGMWSGIMGSSVAFADVPLWDADTSVPYDSAKAPALEGPKPVAYGGWNQQGTSRVMVQQAFEVEKFGVPVNITSVATSFLR